MTSKEEGVNKIQIETVCERDMDFLIMRQFSCGNKEFVKLFRSNLGNHSEIISISHSLTTNDGETDIEVIIKEDNRKIGLLIEDKIDAVAQPEQYNRYLKRATKAQEEGRYDKYEIFIVAPQKYLNGNSEAKLYLNHVSYEVILETLTDPFDISMMRRALDESVHGYVPIEDKQVTSFWNDLYDYVEKQYPNTLKISGKKGESRGTNARWISINSAPGTSIQIKSDRGYIDLEIAGYAERFVEFSKANQKVLDEKQLIVRLASKSLAIRKYIDVIDFTKPFSEQEKLVDNALKVALELRELVNELKY